MIKGRRLSVIAALYATLAGAALPARAQAPSVQREVPYIDDAHPEQVLDFYWPGGSPGATVLFVHGGGLSESGEGRSSPVYEHVCELFVGAGLACATIDYRLAPTFSWPAMPEDVARAIRLTRELVAGQEGEPGRLFLFGHSSGCQLVATVAANPEYLGSVGLTPADLAGIVAMGCVLDPHDAALRELTADQMRAGLLDDQSDLAVYGSAENRIAANPSYHIGPHVPPTLVVVAEHERFFPSVLEQGARFVRRLLEFGVSADLVIVPGRHMSSIEGLGTAEDRVLPSILAFIADPGLGRNR